MKLGLGIVETSWQGGASARFAARRGRRGRRGRRLRHDLRRGPRLAPSGHRRATWQSHRGLYHPRVHCRTYEARPPHGPGDGGVVSARRVAGEDRHDARRAVRRPRDARHRLGRLPRGGGGPGAAVPGDGARTVRPPRGDRPGLPRDVGRRARQRARVRGRARPARAGLEPSQSLGRPHPPILIAGGGEKRTLPLVARYADACNIRPSPEIPRQLELLRRLCDEAGRDYHAIEKTAPFAFDVGDDRSKVGELLDQLRWLAGMGIEMVSGWVVGVDRITPIEIMGREVIPAAAEFAG
jgi:hypothetical protein